MILKYFLTPSAYRVIKEIKDHKRDKKVEAYLKNVEKYRDKHEGQRCFILGNGPSLSSVDFSQLADEYTFSVNQLPRNKEFKSLKTTYHMWSDRIFFELKSGCPEDMELLEVMKSVNSGGNQPTVFYEITALPMIKEFHLESEVAIEYFKCVNLNLDIMLKQKLDFTHSVPNMPTVVHSAVCLAVYMGFKEIYLLGCDCTGFINTAKNKLALGNESMYGYTITDNERKRMEKAANQRSVKDELESYVKLLEVYEQLYTYCKNNGVCLYNATEGSLLESVPRVRIETVLQTNKRLPQ